MKNIIIIIGIFATTLLNAQDKYFTRSGKISFFSKTDMENIEAVNNKSSAVIDIKTGQMEFAVLMKGFEFKKELMMEHFNENYVESDKYPKSVFKGTIMSMPVIDLTKDGVYPVKVKGQLTIHGVTNDVISDATLEVKERKLIGKSTFNVALADYKIEVPNLVKDNISKTIKIDVVSPYEKMQ